MIKSQNLKAYWKLEGNADDSSGNGYDGTLDEAGSFPVTIVKGKSGNAYHFANNANTGSIQSRVITGLRSGDINKPCTWTAWFKCDNTNSAVNSGTQRVITRATGGSTRSSIGVEGGYLSINITSGGGNQVGTAITLDNDRWYYVAVVFDQTQTRTYLDAILRNTSTSVMNDLAAGAGDLIVLGTQAGGQRGFIGTLDEEVIYDKALTPSEIKRDMLGLHAF